MCPELVNAYIPEPLLTESAHLVVLVKQADCLHDYVVEIEGICVGQLFLIEGIYRRYLREPEVGAYFGGEGLRSLEVVFQGAYLRQNAFRREFLVIDLKIVHTGDKKSLRVVGVVDGEAAGIAYSLSVFAQESDADGVEGSRPDIVCVFLTDGGGKSCFHLVCRLVGEGYAEDRPRGTWVGDVFA